MSFAKTLTQALFLITLFSPNIVYSNTVNFYLYDSPGGSVISMVDNSCNIVGTYKYDVFGNITAQSSGQINTYKYNGEYSESETGLIFLRNRYYDPSIGRFIIKDYFSGSKSNPKSINSYVYAYNNPASRNIDSLPYYFIFSNLCNKSSSLRKEVNSYLFYNSLQCNRLCKLSTCLIVCNAIDCVNCLHVYTCL
jgi:RHS repeat-associated protein